MIIEDISRDREAIAAAHAFLATHFGPEELEPLSHYLDALDRPGPPLTLILAGWEDGGIACVSTAAVIALGRGQRAIGGVGHALVAPHLRGTGLAVVLNDAIERSLHDSARDHGLVLEAFALESEADARWFWGKVGYRWPAGCRFTQPPLAWSPAGAPALPAVPLLLLLKPLRPATTMPLARARLYTRALLVDWYRDELDDLIEDPIARQRARDWMDAHIIAPALASLSVDPTPLRDPRDLPEDVLHA